MWRTSALVERENGFMVVGLPTRAEQIVMVTLPQGGPGTISFMKDEYLRRPFIWLSCLSLVNLVIGVPYGAGAIMILNVDDRKIVHAPAMLFLIRLEIHTHPSTQ